MVFYTWAFKLKHQVSLNFVYSSFSRSYCWLSKQCTCISLSASYNFWSAHCGRCRWPRHYMIHYWSAHVLLLSAAGTQWTRCEWGKRKTIEAGNLTPQSQSRTSLFLIWGKPFKTSWKTSADKRHNMVQLPLRALCLISRIHQSK